MGDHDNRRMFRRIALILIACGVGSAPAIAAETAPAPLSLADFYKRPVGPRGLEATANLLSLQGQRVRLTGFVAHAPEAPQDYPIILAPVPITLTDEDEALADDLPASVAYIHGAGAAVADAMRRCRGPVQAIGVLAIGPLREADARVSYVRLRLESARCAMPAS